MRQIVTIRLRTPAGVEPVILQDFTPFEIELPDGLTVPVPGQPAPPVVVPPVVPPSQPPVDPPVVVTPGTDAFNLSTVVWTGGGGDVGRWPITTAITRLALTSAGFDIDFSKKQGLGAWPMSEPPKGWDGGLSWTLWAGQLLADGTIHMVAILDSWAGEAIAGGPVTTPSHWPQNLWYLDPAMKFHQPAVGEPIAFLVTAGGLRGLSMVTVQERSNVVVINFPNGPDEFRF